MTTAPVKRGPGRPRKTESDKPSFGGQSDGVRSTSGWLANRANPPAPLIDPRRAGRKGINLKAVSEILIERGLDPVAEIVRIYQTEQLDPDVRIRVMSTLMEYVHAKRKSVEITGAEGGAIKVESMSNDVLAAIAAQALANTVDELTLDDVTDVEVKEMLK